MTCSPSIKRQRRKRPRLLRVERPLVVRVGQAEVFVEAAAQRQELDRPAEVPLAHHAGRVALLLHHLRERQLALVEAELEPRLHRPLDADAIGITTGQERRARRRADRLRDVEIREAHALAREPVEVRRRETLRPIDADIGVTEVIGQDEDDVRRPFRRGGRAGRLAAIVARSKTRDAGE